MQTTLVFIILIAAVAYASVRIVSVLKGTTDPCKDCELKKNCQKFGHSKEK
ncbi:MAG: hypothetical protein K2K03_07755 [Prevotella sp.]|nr:hypothetical protein [Prevotella sp.]